MPQIDCRWSILSILFVLLLTAAGCSSGNSSAVINPDSGHHTEANWTEKHGHQFLNQFSSEPDECKECHGADYHGGISGVSCFMASYNGAACHVGGPEGHPNTDAWKFPASPTASFHGTVAKMAPTMQSGFSFCQVCHATSFKGGLVSQTCFSNPGCHGNDHGSAPSPHPNSWLPDDVFTHSTTNVLNAPVCAQCHFHRKNIPADANALLPPFVPAPAGTPVGCFNNTLCHLTIAPGSHDDPNWVTTPPAMEDHGNLAKSPPGVTSGFTYCQQCHAVDFTGNGAGVSCVNNCHGTAAPHAPKWLPDNGGTYFHMTTDVANAPVCGQCHTNQQNLPASDVPSDFPPFVPAPAGTPPGCFNNTLCHGNLGPHTLPAWLTGPAPNSHWSQASGKTLAEIEASCGFVGCHGPALQGSGGPSCYSCHLGNPSNTSGIMHPDNWADPRSSHPDYLETKGDKATSCSPVSPSGQDVAQYCHGTNLLQSAARVAAPNGLWPQAPSCYTCHGKEWVAP
jgi:hypothetical protein